MSLVKEWHADFLRTNQAWKVGLLSKGVNLKLKSTVPLEVVSASKILPIYSQIEVPKRTSQDAVKNGV